MSWGKKCHFTQIRWTYVVLNIAPLPGLLWLCEFMPSEEEENEGLIICAIWEKHVFLLTAP